MGHLDTAVCPFPPQVRFYWDTTNPWGGCERVFPREGPAHHGDCVENTGTSIPTDLTRPLNSHFCVCLIIHVISVPPHRCIIYKGRMYPHTGCACWLDVLWKQRMGDISKALGAFNPLIGWKYNTNLRRSEKIRVSPPGKDCFQTRVSPFRKQYQGMNIIHTRQAEIGRMLVFRREKRIPSVM